MVSFFSRLLQVFESGSVCHLFFAGMIIYCVGKPIMERRPWVATWGLKLGVLSFVAWFVREFLNHGVGSAEQLWVTACRAVIVMLNATATSWILLAIGSCLYHDVFGWGHRWIKARRTRAAERKRARRKPRRQSAPVAQHDPEAELDELERQKLLRDQEQLRANETQRRAEMRYDVELLYDRYRSELTEKFPPERFADYFETHLTKDIALEVYEHRSEKLKAMIRECLDLDSRRVRHQFDSLEGIVGHFAERKQRLQLLDLDSDEVETLQCAIDDMMDREIRKFLSN